MPFFVTGGETKGVVRQRTRRQGVRRSMCASDDRVSWGNRKGHGASARTTGNGLAGRSNGCSERTRGAARRRRDRGLIGGGCKAQNVREQVLPTGLPLRK